MINHFKGLWLLSAGLFVVSCGGGGGGGGGGGNASGTFTMSANSVTFAADVQDPRPNVKILEGDVTGAEGSFYIFVEFSEDGIIENATAEINGDEGQLFLTPGLPYEVGNGIHSGTLTVSVCSDSGCNSHLNGSPKTIDVTYTITPLDNLTLDADVSVGGGFTEALGSIQCSTSCQELIYGEDGDTIRLWPQEQPGYAFTGWSGDCAGMSSCTFTFQTDSVVEVTANFAPSAATFDPCPGDEKADFSGKGTVSLFGVHDFIPLCNGHAILAMDDGQIIVRDVINEANSATYQPSSIAYKLALDEENGFLYATHFDERKITRINLATDLVSELYYRGGGESYEATAADPSPVIAVTDEGTLIAPDYEELGFLSRRSYLYDSATGMYQKTSGLLFEERYKYIDAAGGLFTSFSGRWYFYLFDAANQRFTLRSNGSIGGTNCRDAIMSPDSSHVAVLCGGGNSGAGYIIYDWDGVNSTPFDNIKIGEWEIGFPMSSGNFSPSGDLVMFAGRVHNGLDFVDSIKLFSVDTYLPLWTAEGDTTLECESRIITSKITAFSTDEKLVYSLGECGTEGDVALTWVSIASPE